MGGDRSNSYIDSTAVCKFFPYPFEISLVSGLAFFCDFKGSINLLKMGDGELQKLLFPLRRGRKTERESGEGQGEFRKLVFPMER